MTGRRSAELIGAGGFRAAETGWMAAAETRTPDATKPLRGGRRPWMASRGGRKTDGPAGRDDGSAAPGRDDAPTVSRAPLGLAAGRAFAAVRYEGGCFWVASDDLASKRVSRGCCC